MSEKLEKYMLSVISCSNETKAYFIFVFNSFQYSITESVKDIQQQHLVQSKTFSPNPFIHVFGISKTLQGYYCHVLTYYSLLHLLERA